MLVLSRRRGESIVVRLSPEVVEQLSNLHPEGIDLVFEVVECRGDGRVRLGVNAPSCIPVHRSEVQALIDREGGRHGGQPVESV